jgi:hypothetical protein
MMSLSEYRMDAIYILEFIMPLEMALLPLESSLVLEGPVEKTLIKFISMP